MPVATIASRCAIALALLSLAVLPATAAGDQTRIQQSPAVATPTAEPPDCPVIGATDTAGAIDCEVNQALRTRAPAWATAQRHRGWPTAE